MAWHGAAPENGTDGLPCATRRWPSLGTGQTFMPSLFTYSTHSPRRSLFAFYHNSRRLQTRIAFAGAQCAVHAADDAWSYGGLRGRGSTGPLDLETN